MLESEDGWPRYSYYRGERYPDESPITAPELLLGTRNHAKQQEAVGTRGGTRFRNKGSLEGTFSPLRLRSGMKVS